MTKQRQVKQDAEDQGSRGLNAEHQEGQDNIRNQEARADASPVEKKPRT